MAQSFQSLDAQSLIVAQTTVSFITAPFTSPSYNFPLFLFGVYASERAESPESLRLFSGFLAVSVILDLIWLIKTSNQNGFIKALSILNLLLKAPTLIAVINALRLRGIDISSFATNQFTGNQTVWTMPGAFSGRAGYQDVGDGDLENQTAQPQSAPAPGSAPQRGNTPPGGYQVS